MATVTSVLSYGGTALYKPSSWNLAGDVYNLTQMQFSPSSVNRMTNGRHHVGATFWSKSQRILKLANDFDKTPQVLKIQAQSPIFFHYTSWYFGIIKELVKSYQLSHYPCSQVWSWGWWWFHRGWSGWDWGGWLSCWVSNMGCRCWETQCC